MALASAGCEMSSSSYTAGPRPELPGLWAAELASVASTQALQRAWQAGLRGRRQRKERLGTSQEQAGQVRRWLRSGEARARMAGRAGSAYGEPPMSRCGPAFPRSFRPSNRRKRRIAHVMELSQTCYDVSWFLHGIRIFAIWSCGCDSGMSQWYRVGDAGALRAEP